jgi:hypothetical protein
MQSETAGPKRRLAAAVDFWFSFVLKFTIGQNYSQ